jgi:hypothetical protein
VVENFAKAVLITTGGFLMLPIALETGKVSVLLLVAAVLLAWFSRAGWRLITLSRARAYRPDAEQWMRDSFGFAAGIMLATPVLLILVSAATAVRGPDERTITAAPKAVFELALDRYQADVGSYPTSQEGLAAPFVNPGAAKWEGPYLKPDFRRYFEWFDYSVADGKPVLVARPRDLWHSH